ncbi:MAG: Fic family protein [Rhodospirillales bacterium]
MMSFIPTFEAHAPLNFAILQAVAAIHEYRGKEALYRQQAPQALETLRQVAVIQSVESSNRIEQVIAPPQRIRQLVAQKTQPRNRSEQEIAGYRDVLNTIHRDHGAIPFSPNIVLQFHRDLLAYVGGSGGAWKMADNSIAEIDPDGTRRLRFQPLPAYRTAAAMAELHDRFEASWAVARIPRLSSIAAYVLDFLCIHPFADGNGRMARLLALLLLYRDRYDVGRFISLERIIEESKESYYETLTRAHRAGTRASMTWRRGPSTSSASSSAPIATSRTGSAPSRTRAAPSRSWSARRSKPSAGRSLRASCKTAARTWA